MSTGDGITATPEKGQGSDDCFCAGNVYCECTKHAADAFHSCCDCAPTLSDHYTSPLRDLQHACPSRCCHTWSLCTITGSKALILTPATVWTLGKVVFDTVCCSKNMGNRYSSAQKKKRKMIIVT